MRVNKNTPGQFALNYQSDKGNRMVRSTLPLPKREKQPHEALSPDESLHWKRRPVYKVGDMDHNVYIPRDGSCHKHLKSFGDNT